MAAIALIVVYQTVFSPLKFLLFAGAGSCRFYPTCSSYARECVRRHGFVLGLGLSVWRLLKCHPFHPGGFDPAPKRLRLFARCGCDGETSREGAPAEDLLKANSDNPLKQPAFGRIWFRLRRLLHG